LTGHFADAADFYARLLQKSDPGLNRPQLQFRLVRSLAILQRNDEAVGAAQDFLSRYADSDEAPEVRYYLAESLKALGRNNEALQQVLLCLREQKSKTKNDPEVWAYWQQRVGNEIANQLFREGDYVKALEVYLNLAQLDSSAAWQVPVDYQLGMTYEKLLQPQKAIEAYNEILARETETGTNATPGLKAVFDMARWRVGFIKWQTNAEALDHSLAKAALAAIDSTNFQTNLEHE
jgi:tetratricopeptide (TPR) repeat protein